MEKLAADNADPFREYYKRVLEEYNNPNTATEDGERCKKYKEWFEQGLRENPKKNVLAYIISKRYPKGIFMAPEQCAGLLGGGTFYIDAKFMDARVLRAIHELGNSDGARTVVLCLGYKHIENVGDQLIASNSGYREIYSTGPCPESAPPADNIETQLRGLDDALKIRTHAGGVAAAPAAPISSPVDSYIACDDVDGLVKLCLSDHQQYFYLLRLTSGAQTTRDMQKKVQRRVGLLRFEDIW